MPDQPGSKGETGQRAERSAAEYLKQKGYTIIAYNWRASGCEVDLIASHDETLCFIEVKSRRSTDFGTPEEYVGWRKRQKFIRAAKLFTARKPYRDYRIRFDIVTLTGSEGNFTISHIENAFEND